MSLIDLIGTTATREELIELLRGTEEQRQTLDRQNAAMRAFVEMVALDRDDRASPGLKRQASLMLQDLAADNFNPDKPR